MLQVRFVRPGLGTDVPAPVLPGPAATEPPPAAVPTLSVPLLSDPDYTKLQGANLCPHWQRLNPRGNCVDQWWVGPPLSWFAGAVITTLGMAMIGWALVVASKIKPLEKAVGHVRKVVKAPTWE